MNVRSTIVCSDNIRLISNYRNPENKQRIIMDMSTVITDSYLIDFYDFVYCTIYGQSVINCRDVFSTTRKLKRYSIEKNKYYPHFDTIAEISKIIERDYNYGLYIN